MNTWLQIQTQDDLARKCIKSARKCGNFARKCVDCGNSLLKEHNVSGAISKYDQAIENRPYYAIPHYNKRIALSMQNNILSNAMEHTEVDTNLLINKAQDSNLANQVSPYFVVSIIAAVPEHRFSNDSSDEEPDEKFNALYEKLVNNHDWPFTTRPKKIIKHKKKLDCFEPKYSYKNQDTVDSIVVDPLLSKVLANGFEFHEKNKLSTIAVSIGLNRMYSLSTRKNNSLTLELESQVNTKEIKFKKFGYFWKCSWYTKNGEEANIAHVRKFYKKLKKQNSVLSKMFLAQEENTGAECNVPYRHIREYAKNHPKTKELIKAFRDNNYTAMLYLHLVDADVLDFNGVYSAYSRIIAGCYKPPTVMSTGYEFPKDTQSMAYYLLGHMERMHRVITTFHIPLGTYYPEPNMCILIPQNCPTVEESFITCKFGNTHESPILLEEIQNKRQNVYAIFSEDNPIITNIPSRAKVSKQTKQSIKFSPEFNTGPAAPTFDDIKKYNQVSQSHCHNLAWAQNLFINKSIKYLNNYETDGEYIYSKNNKPLTVNQQCNRFIANIRKDCDVELSQFLLSKRIGEDNSNNIVNATKDIQQFQKYFNTKYERTPEEQEFIDILKVCNIRYGNLSRKCLLMIVNSQIMQLIKDDQILTQTLVDLDEDLLENIIYSDQIIQALVDKEVDIANLIDLLRDNLEDFNGACDNGYSVQQIIELYKTDPLHLQYMGNDPWDVVYTNSDDECLVNFAIDHKYIDGEDIMSISNELLQGRDDSAANQEFQAILLRREDEGQLGLTEEEEYDMYCYS